MIKHNSKSIVQGTIDEEIRGTSAMPRWEFCCSEHYTHHSPDGTASDTLAPHGAAALSHILKARNVSPAGSGKNTPPRIASRTEEDSGTYVINNQANEQ